MNTLIFTDPNYPALLKQICDPPGRLFYQGDLEALAGPCVAIVGTRRSTPQGEANAFHFAKSLAQAGICIVSGLAFGIDLAAHRGALEAKGRTIAVVAQSLKELRPHQHRIWAKKIVEEGGLVLSEKLPGIPCYKMDYLVRNRLISGLSLGVLVVEAPIRSGAVNTACHALDQNRSVMALPGRLSDEQSQGSNRLIRDGARLVSTALDVLEELGLEGKLKKRPNLNALEEKILKLLQENPKNVSALSEHFPSNPTGLYKSLLELEEKGLILQGGDRRYSVTR